MNTEPLYGFWAYDRFPFTLSGVIDETKPLRDGSPAARYVTSFDGYFNMISTIRGAKGEKLAADLKVLEANYSNELNALGKRYKVNLHSMLVNAGISHPSLKDFKP